MIRINLLPPEIVEKRRNERNWVFVAAGALAAAVFVAAFWMFMFLSVQSKVAEKSDREQQAQSLIVQAERFKVFEDKQSDLQQRRAVADRALASRVNWSRLFTEVSLVLPNDVWVEQMTVDQKTGVQLMGWAVDGKGGASDRGHKAVAKVLVRLNDLEQLTNVWLGQSEKSSFLDQPAMHFSITSGILTTGTPGVPAPPTPTTAQ